jgi:hypothetical protein
MRSTNLVILFDIGKFSLSLDDSVIVPVHNKGSNINSCNYCGISYQILEKNKITMRLYLLFIDIERSYASVLKEILYNI